MRLLVKVLVVTLGTLIASHLVAIWTESQLAAQLSWLLAVAVTGLAAFILGDIIVTVARQNTS